MIDSANSSDDTKSGGLSSYLIGRPQSAQVEANSAQCAFGSWLVEDAASTSPVEFVPSLVARRLYFSSRDLASHNESNYYHISSFATSLWEA